MSQIVDLRDDGDLAATAVNAQPSAGRGHVAGITIIR
jgi:hypothetical protein